MKILNLRFLAIFTGFLMIAGTFSSCSDDEPFVTISVNEGPSGDIGGDFTGDGGTGSRTISWTNNSTTADYNADITASNTGAFRLLVVDANNAIVLDQTITAGTEPDTIGGVTEVGEPGIWTVTISLTSFNGSGSYSLSAGN